MRLMHDMNAERDRLGNLATGFASAGERELARKATYAAQAMAAAVTALDIYTTAAADAQARTGDPI